MPKHITSGQIRELLEIDARQGIGEQVQGFIRRLTSGGVAGGSGNEPCRRGDHAGTCVVIREAQAKRYWNLGVGMELGHKSFAEYLASIPVIPEALKDRAASFPIMVLVEPRVGLKRLCELGNIVFDGSDNTFQVHDCRHSEFTQPTWICIQDGRKNRNRSVVSCRKRFDRNEVGLTALQGVCSYLQHPTVVSECTQKGAHVMKLCGSVFGTHSDIAPYLGVFEGEVALGYDGGDSTSRAYGSASRLV